MQAAKKLPAGSRPLPRELGVPVPWGSRWTPLSSHTQGIFTRYRRAAGISSCYGMKKKKFWKRPFGVVFWLSGETPPISRGECGNGRLFLQLERTRGVFCGLCCHLLSFVGTNSSFWVSLHSDKGGSLIVPLGKLSMLWHA